VAGRGATAGTRKIEKYDSARLYLSNIQIPEAGTSMPFYIQEPSCLCKKDSLAITRIENIKDIHVAQNGRGW
jgi:hypothetical protein